LFLKRYGYKNEQKQITVVYLVLPVNPENLPNEMLDAVSGGICYENYRCSTDWYG
jgi:hypothetical protein